MWQYDIFNFVGSLAKNLLASLSPRSRLIAMYAMCGFENVSAVAIQIGALTQLAPGQAGAIAQVALSALVSGVFATLTSAAVAGMLLVEGKCPFLH
jgi:concentrative nucleoside transporter, CNT family